MGMRHRGCSVRKCGGTAEAGKTVYGEGQHQLALSLRQLYTARAMLLLLERCVWGDLPEPLLLRVTVGYAQIERKSRLGTRSLRYKCYRFSSLQIPTCGFTQPVRNSLNPFLLKHDQRAPHDPVIVVQQRRLQRCDGKASFSGPRQKRVSRNVTKVQDAYRWQGQSAAQQIPRHPRLIQVIAAVKCQSSTYGAAG